MTEYQRALAKAIVERHNWLYANYHTKPTAIRLQHAEIHVIAEYIAETTRQPMLDVGPTDSRVLGMRVIEVAVAPTNPRDRFVFGEANR